MHCKDGDYLIFHRLKWASFPVLPLPEQFLSDCIGGRAGRMLSHFRQDALGHFLSQFHSPLIEAENIPDPSLAKNLVLVKRHKLAKYKRGQFLVKEDVAGSVALENAVGKQLLHFPGRDTFSSHIATDLFFIQTVHQGLRLGKEVGQ